MTADLVEVLRQNVIGRLTGLPGVAWTVTSKRLAVRRGGKALCRVGRDDVHVLVEFPAAVADAETLAALSFVRVAPASEGHPETWRQARLASEAQADQLLAALGAGPTRGA